MVPSCQLWGQREDGAGAGGEGSGAGSGGGAVPLSSSRPGGSRLGRGITAASGAGTGHPGDGRWEEESLWDGNLSSPLRRDETQLCC